MNPRELFEAANRETGQAIRFGRIGLDVAARHCRSEAAIFRQQAREILTGAK